MNEIKTQESVIANYHKDINKLKTNFTKLSKTLLDIKTKPAPNSHNEFKKGINKNSSDIDILFSSLKSTNEKINSLSQSQDKITHEIESLSSRVFNVSGDSVFSKSKIERMIKDEVDSHINQVTLAINRNRKEITLRNAINKTSAINKSSIKPSPKKGALKNNYQPSVSEFQQYHFVSVDLWGSQTLATLSKQGKYYYFDIDDQLNGYQFKSINFHQQQVVLEKAGKTVVLK
ncbi:hypothetical protein [Motilimonas pumila]|nr:hypothetical protein [Motilimonas pumila]